MKVFLFFVIAALSFGTAVSQRADPDRRVINSERLLQSGTITAKEIVEGMRQAYANAQTYQDDGVVSHFTSSGEPNPELSGVRFKTYFKRPTSFRFEWEEVRHEIALPQPFEWPSTELQVIWNDGTNAYSYWEPLFVDWGDPAAKTENLDRAIAGATGVSNGSAHTVSVLLMNDVSGFRVTELERVSFLREEMFDGIDCFVVRGFHPFGFATDLWIGKNDLLLRKVREEDPDGSGQEEIRHNVKPNEPIDETIFQFVPPRKGISSLGWTLPYLFVMIPMAVLIYLLRLAVWKAKSGQ